MAYEVDYSAGHPTNLGAAKGAIRYIGTPGNNKNLTPAEAAGLRAHGYEILGVYEGTASWMLGGFGAGQAAARAVQADIAACGLPPGLPCYFACDFQPTAAQLPACLAALDGAASVLGKSRVGAYGFAGFIGAAISGVRARYFWQCGARSALVPGVNIYQHNNDSTTVEGIAADIDEILTADYGQSPLVGGALMALSDAEQAELLADVRLLRDQIVGPGLNADGSFKGWVGLPGKPDGTLVDMTRYVARQFNDPQPSRVPGYKGDISSLRDAILDTNSAAFQTLAVAKSGASVTVDAATLTTALNAAFAAHPVNSGPSADDIAAAVMAALKSATVTVSGKVG